MADRQTTGGYPKIATVIAADLTIGAGQLSPGEPRRLYAVCTAREATCRADRAVERTLMALEERLPA